MITGADPAHEIAIQRGLLAHHHWRATHAKDAEESDDARAAIAACERTISEYEAKLAAAPAEAMRAKAKGRGR